MISNLAVGSPSEDSLQTDHASISEPLPLPERASEASLAGNSAPDISLLAFNATGEMKYLGPSSGAFFATYAAAIAQSIASDHAGHSKPGATRRQQEIAKPGASIVPSEDHVCVSLPEAQHLLQSYIMWVHSLYHLFSSDFLDSLIRQCCTVQSSFSNQQGGQTQNASNMTIFYLVMALGATNSLNTARQHPGENWPGSSPRPSPQMLYARAMQHFARFVRNVRPSMTMIQVILLICLYSSYGPIGSSQWQLAGLAMRVWNPSHLVKA
jgi:hypothetical protein